jgi:hypothetical protein
MSVSTRDPLAPPKEFLRELACADDRHNRRREGRTAMTSPSRPPTVAPGAPATATAAPPKSVATLLSAPVILHLRGGTRIQGMLAAILTYEFVIRISDGGYVFIMKHSVDVLAPAGKE